MCQIFKCKLDVNAYMIVVKTRNNLDCNQSWVLQAFAERSGGGLRGRLGGSCPCGSSQQQSSVAVSLSAEDRTTTLIGVLEGTLQWLSPGESMVSPESLRVKMGSFITLFLHWIKIYHDYPKYLILFLDLGRNQWDDLGCSRLTDR